MRELHIHSVAGRVGQIFRLQNYELLLQHVLLKNIDASIDLFLRKVENLRNFLDALLETSHLGGNYDDSCYFGFQLFAFEKIGVLRFGEEFLGFEDGRLPQIKPLFIFHNFLPANFHILVSARRVRKVSVFHDGRDFLVLGIRGYESGKL